MTAVRSRLLVLLAVSTFAWPADAATPTTVPTTAPARATPTYLSGIVTLADGVTPFGKATVMARPVGDRTVQGTWLDQTDENGCFVLSRPLAPGRYTVSVSQNLGDAPLQEIEVVPQSGPIGLHLKMPPATLRGRVTDPSGAPVANTMVMLSNRGQRLYYNINTDGNGNYTFAYVLPGPYDITTTSARSSPAGEKAGELLMSRVRGIQIGEADLTQDLALQPRPRRVASTTQASTSTSRPTTAPAARPTLTAVLTLPDGATPVAGQLVVGQPADDRETQASWFARTDKDGLLKVFEPVRPGTYRVRVLDKKSAYLPIQNIEIAAGGAGQEFRMRLPAGSVSGRVLDDAGRPVEGVSISLSSPGNDGGYRATTDAGGAYQINYVLPGKYRTMATRHRGKPGGTVMMWESRTVDVEAGPVTHDFGAVPGPATAPATQP